MDDLHIKTFNLGAVDIVDLRARRWRRREVKAWLLREKLKGIADRKALTDRDSGHLLSPTTLTGRGALGRVGPTFAGQQKVDNLLRGILHDQ